MKVIIDKLQNDAGKASKERELSHQRELVALSNANHYSAYTWTSTNGANKIENNELKSCESHKIFKAILFRLDFCDSVKKKTTDKLLVCRGQSLSS